MGPIDSGNWRTARAGGMGLLHLAVSLLLFLALTASHGLVSPHWSLDRHGFGYVSHDGPLERGYSKGIESVSHVRSRVVAKNVSPWRRETALSHTDQTSPYLNSLPVSLDLPARGSQVAPATIAGIPGGQRPRAYDAQGPPPAAA